LGGQCVNPREKCTLGYVSGRGAKNYLHRVTGRRSRNGRKKRGLRILSIVLPLVRYQHVNSEATTGIFSTSDKLNRPAVMQLDSLFAAPPKYALNAVRHVPVLKKRHDAVERLRVRLHLMRRMENL